MDQVGTDKAKVLADLQNRLDEGCIDFSEITEETYDSLAMCDEKAMEEYLESEKIEEDTIAEIIGNRKGISVLFWFGAEDGRRTGIHGWDDWLHREKSAEKNRSGIR